MNFHIRTTKASEITLLTIGFFVFLTGLVAIRYNGFFAWLIIGGSAIMIHAGEALQQIAILKKRE